MHRTLHSCPHCLQGPGNVFSLFSYSPFKIHVWDMFEFLKVVLSWTLNCVGSKCANIPSQVFHRHHCHSPLIPNLGCSGAAAAKWVMNGFGDGMWEFSWSFFLHLHLQHKIWMQAVKDAKIKSHSLLPEFTVCMSNPLSQLLLSTPHLFALRTCPLFFPTPGHKLHFFSQRYPWAMASCVPTVLSASHISLTSLKNK